MTASVDIIGTRRIVSVTPTDTNETTLYTVPSGSPKGSDVVQLWITNLTAGSLNATVQWHDGTSDFSLIDTYAVAARTYHKPDDFFVPLPTSGAIKVTSSSGNGLTFTIVVVEFSGAVGGRA